MMLTSLVAIMSLVFSSSGGDDVVAATALPRGTVLTTEMMIGDELSGLVGKSLKRPIFAGRAISLSDVELPALVSRQDAVTIIFQRQGLVVSTVGRALGSGAQGDAITVLVEGSRRPVSGRIIATGTVEVIR